MIMAGLFWGVKTTSLLWKVKLPVAAFTSAVTLECLSAASKSSCVYVYVPVQVKAASSSKILSTVKGEPLEVQMRLLTVGIETVTFLSRIVPVLLAVNVYATTSPVLQQQ